MARVTVYEPVADGADPAKLDYAVRGDLPAEIRLTLVDNSKPRARDLLECIADEIGDTLSIRAVDFHSKAHAGKPLSADEAQVIAARSHLVITGVGD